MFGLDWQQWFTIAAAVVKVLAIVVPLIMSLV